MAALVENQGQKVPRQAFRPLLGGMVSWLSQLQCKGRPFPSSSSSLPSPFVCSLSSLLLPNTSPSLLCVGLLLSTVNLLYPSASLWYLWLPHLLYSLAPFSPTASCLALTCFLLCK